MCHHIPKNITINKNTQLKHLFSTSVMSCNPIGLKVSRKFIEKDLIEKDLHDPKKKSLKTKCAPGKFSILLTMRFFKF